MRGLRNPVGCTKVARAGRGDRSITVIPDGGMRADRKSRVCFACCTSDRDSGFLVSLAPRNDDAQMARWLRLPPRGRDDFLQRRDMAGERTAPGGSRGHRGLGLFADKGLVDRDIARLRKRLDMGAEIAIGRTGQLFEL